MSADAFDRFVRAWRIDYLHRLATEDDGWLDGAPRCRSFGCECGAGLHEGETHEQALACEAVEASTACDCGGYAADDGSGEVGHDGYCPLSPWPETPMRGVVEGLVASGFSVTSEGGVFVVVGP